MLKLTEGEIKRELVNAGCKEGEFPKIVGSDTVAVKRGVKVLGVPIGHKEYVKCEVTAFCQAVHHQWRGISVCNAVPPGAAMPHGR